MGKVVGWCTLCQRNQLVLRTNLPSGTVSNDAHLHMLALLLLLSFIMDKKHVYPFCWLYADFVVNVAYLKYCHQIIPNQHPRKCVAFCNLEKC